MNQQKLKPGPLLDQKGHVNEAGYHTSLVKTYRRKDVKVKGLRIKEWDYYYIGDHEKGVAFTVADNSYMWLTSITVFDFIKKKEYTQTNMGFLSLGKLKHPETSHKGDLTFKRKGLSFSFLHEKNKRHLIVESKKFNKGEGFYADLILEESIEDSMVIVTPFEKKKHFYYNQKINLLQTNGYFKVGNQTQTFQKAYGVLDWGRGVWTYKNTWYWSSLSGEYQGQKIGFNLGYGFGDTSKASENMLFVDDKTYKLNDVIFDIPQEHKKDDFMSPWKIYSKNKDIDLIFTPILDRHSHSNIILISSNQHQVFGHFSGTFKVSPTKTIEINDMIGFAEKVQNRW